MNELVIKVPAPFAGTELVGFSTRYPEQAINEPLRDVTFFVEGMPDLLARLWPHLVRFPELSRRAHQGYLWTDPVMISDELCVIAYRDRSAELLEPSEIAHQYFANMLQPLVIPFLRDCVTVGNLRLADRIQLSMNRDSETLAALELERGHLLSENGTLSLVD
ncbi:MAG: hypothetical protein ACYDGR_11145 [Candidatus Dormibacteria bacterium]